MARHVTYVPDCPECGAETGQRAESGEAGFAKWRWWECPRCGWESDRARGWDAFAELTRELTAGLRKGDGE